MQKPVHDQILLYLMMQLLICLDSDNDIIDYLYDYVKLPQQGISLDRVTKCSCRPNDYGRKLLDLCKKNNLYIANSRTGFDKNIGRQTCKYSSVIDYLILSSELFSIVNDFSVNDSVPLYSDCHNLIDFSFRVKLENKSLTNTVEDKNTFMKWRNEKREDFVNYVHDDSKGKLASISEKLNEIAETESSLITKNQVNDFVTDIGKIFIDAAIETFGKK